MLSFRQWLHESIIGYHGSDRPSEKRKFNAKSKSVNNMGILGNIETTRHGAFFSDNPEFAKSYGKNVTKHKLKLKKTYDLDQNDYKGEIENRFNAFGKDREHWLTLKHGTNHKWQMFDGEVGKRFVKHLKSKGYDSAKFGEHTQDSDGKEHAGTTTVVFNKRRIFQKK